MGDDDENITGEADILLGETVFCKSCFQDGVQVGDGQVVSAFVVFDDDDSPWIGISRASQGAFPAAVLPGGISSQQVDADVFVGVSRQVDWADGRDAEEGFKGFLEQGRQMLLSRAWSSREEEGERLCAAVGWAHSPGDGELGDDGVDDIVLPEAVLKEEVADFRDVLEGGAQLFLVPA